MRKSLIEYLDGGLSEAERRDIGRHIEECPKCLELAGKLETSTGSLSTLKHPVTLPGASSESILRNLRHEIAIKEPPGKLAVMFSSGRGAAIAGAAAVVLLLVVVFGGITISLTSRNWRQPSGEVSNLATKTAEEKESETDILSVTESGPEDQSREALPSGTSRPDPEVKITAADYNAQTLKDNIDNLELIDKFSSGYTMSDAINLKKEFTSQLAAGFTSQSQDGELLRSMIDFVSTGETVLLPCYAEKASFSGQNAFIICLVAPTRTGESLKLSRVEIWVLSPEMYVSNPNTSLLNWQQIDE